MMNNKIQQPSPRIALITNHGYAGVEIPVGGAPDTGGQNFYVNSLALALEEIGYEVTIFTRGGFPFFGRKRIREGTEKLSEHVRYVYIPGGGASFIRKEDIAIALDEETKWLDNFIADEAQKADIPPWEFYEIVNTHYWDAAIMAIKLIERWKDSIAFQFLSKVSGGVFTEMVAELQGEEKHRQSLSRELSLHIAEMAQRRFPELRPHELAQKLVPDHVWRDDGAPEQNFAQQMALGKHLLTHLKVDGFSLAQNLKKAETHVWTPHSMGIIKERNFWNKEDEVVRSLKFRERDAHEQVICRRTPLFCSTSREITRALVSYQEVKPQNVFDFPPCIDTNLFKPRSLDNPKDREELKAVYAYLSQQSGIPEKTLKEGKILFETSRMDRTKRKDILLRAFAKVAAKRENVFLFIGGGPSGNPIFKELEELKKSLPSLVGRGFLLGFVPDEVLAPLFSVPDLFVSASEMEGFGMSVSQAAAARVAVVSSDLIPFATQFAKGSAVVVRAGDIEAFAAAIELLLANDAERERRAGELLEVAQKLNWKATAQRFVDWYEQFSL